VPPGGPTPASPRGFQYMKWMSNLDASLALMVSRYSSFSRIASSQQGHHTTASLSSKKHSGHRMPLFDFIFITFIEPQGATHGELNQPSPQFQTDRPL